MATKRITRKQAVSALLRFVKQEIKVEKKRAGEVWDESDQQTVFNDIVEELIDDVWAKMPAA